MPMGEINFFLTHENIKLILIKEKKVMITISLKTAVMKVNLKVAPTLTITEAIYKHHHTQKKLSVVI